MQRNNICENIMVWLVDIDDLCSLLILMETPVILATAQEGNTTCLCLPKYCHSHGMSVACKPGTKISLA